MNVSESSSTSRGTTERVVFAPYVANDGTTTRIRTYQYVSRLVSLVRHKSDEYSNVRRHTRLNTDLYNVFNFIPTLRQTKPRVEPEAAICVRKSSARRVLHFTPLITASCVLHRPASRVIHRLQLYCLFVCLLWMQRHSVWQRVLKLKYARLTMLCRHCFPIIKSGGKSEITLVTPQPDCAILLRVDAQY